MKIELTSKEAEAFERFKEKFKPLPSIGATGGHFGLRIIFTSIGNVIHAISWDGSYEDITDYESM